MTSQLVLLRYVPQLYGCNHLIPIDLLWNYVSQAADDDAAGGIDWGSGDADITIEVVDDSTRQLNTSTGKLFCLWFHSYSRWFLRSPYNHVTCMMCICNV